MDIASTKIVWHYETLPTRAKKALDFLSAQNWLKNSSWYLAGGTALALQTGNRKSLDLDFFDLYWCANNIEPLKNIIVRLKIQYPGIARNYHHILKSLVYFEDAESDPEPEIYFDADWKKIKKFFTKEIPALADELIR